MKICIDAGHSGKYNRSPGARGYYESEMNWKLHLLLKQALEDRGFTVLTTRDTLEEDPELTARGRMAKGCDLFLSLHSNAVGSEMNEEVDYPLGIYQVQDGSFAPAVGKTVAEFLAKTVEQVMGTRQRAQIRSRLSNNDRNGDGVKNDNYYGVLHGARSVEVPGVILEHSFHTNTKAANWLLSEDNLRRLAEAEAEALAKHFLRHPFRDVPKDAWYAPAVAWAWAEDITQGRDGTHFDPDTPITRAEAVAMLYRYAHEQ